MKLITPFFYDDPFELYDLLTIIRHGDEVEYRGKECIVSSWPVLSEDQQNNLSVRKSCELISHQKSVSELIYIKQTKFFDKTYKLKMLDESFKVNLFLSSGKKIMLNIRIQDETGRKFSAVMFDSLSSQNQINWLKHNATFKAKKLRI